MATLAARSQQFCGSLMHSARSDNECSCVIVFFDRHRTIDIDIGDSAGATIIGIDLDPLALVPDFSPDTHDYYVVDITFTGGPSYRPIKVPLSQLDITSLRATAGQ
jgi:hypothetical protein